MAVLHPTRVPRTLNLSMFAHATTTTTTTTRSGGSVVVRARTQ
jgi:hypothetical protein